MSEKNLEFMFEINNVKRFESKTQEKYTSSEIEFYLEKEKNQNIWEKMKAYFNLSYLKKFNLNHLKKLYSALPASY